MWVNVQRDSDDVRIIIPIIIIITEWWFLTRLWTHSTWLIFLLFSFSQQMAFKYIYLFKTIFLCSHCDRAALPCGFPVTGESAMFFPVNFINQLYICEFTRITNPISSPDLYLTSWMLNNYPEYLWEVRTENVTLWLQWCFNINALAMCLGLSMRVGSPPFYFASK